MSDTTSKIYIDPEKLLPELEKYRNPESTIVFANGCFELLHVGHIRYLNAAKDVGDCLIVAVNTDDSMKQIKPDRTPVNIDVERFEILAALEAVDYVIPLNDRTPAGLLQLLKPDVQAKGTDYTPDKIPERKILEEYGGRIEIVGDPKDHSTTDMLKMLKEQGRG